MRTSQRWCTRTQNNMQPTPTSQPERRPFFVVDGPDGTGKTTLVKRLTARYIEHGISCIPARNPAGTVLGRAIRQASIEVTEEQEPVAKARLLCQVAACIQLLQEQYVPNIDNSIVIFDRYLLSTIVYQGFMSGVYMPDFCALYTELTADLPNPDMTIVLHASHAKLMERTGKRRKEVKKGKKATKAQENYNNDVMESEHRLAQQVHGFHYPQSWLRPGSNLIVCDTTDRTEDEVFEYVWGHLNHTWRVAKNEPTTPNMEQATAALDAFS